MPPTLFTLGYESLTIEAFITGLQAAQVKTVLDVRELPLSRKKGFAKSAFCAALSAHDVAYLHGPALGCWACVSRPSTTTPRWPTSRRCAVPPLPIAAPRPIAARATMKGC